VRFAAAVLAFLFVQAAWAQGLRYRVEIDAPRELAATLRKGLNLLRWQDDPQMNAERLRRLADEAVSEARQVAATEGYFSPQVDLRIDESQPEWKIALSLDPGARTHVAEVEIRFTAWRRNQAVEAGVQLTGTARAPSVNLVSQPPVPEGERLSWLVLGRPPSGATQADLGLLQAAAGALLAGGDSVPLDRRIARRLGLDEVSLRGSGELTDRVVAVGKRLSDRLYISYEQGLGAVVTNLIKLDYALGRRWTLRAETGSSSGGGLYYRYSWD